MSQPHAHPDHRFGGDGDDRLDELAPPSAGAKARRRKIMVQLLLSDDLTKRCGGGGVDAVEGDDLRLHMP
jgi:hypothetical protein